MKQIENFDDFLKLVPDYVSCDKNTVYIFNTTDGEFWFNDEERDTSFYIPYYTDMNQLHNILMNFFHDKFEEDYNEMFVCVKDRVYDEESDYYDRIMMFYN